MTQKIDNFIDGKIYKITNNITNKIYIGQTKNSLEERFKEHCFPSSQCVYISNSIQKYGKENFKIELIDTADNYNDLNKLEGYYIEQYNSLSPNGYNLSSFCNGKIIHEETKQKLRNAVLNRKNKNNSSRFLGVYICSDRKKYRSYIHIGKSFKYICENNSELICAFFYNKFVLDNNIEDRILNQFTNAEEEEIINILNEQNISYLNKIRGVYYNKRNKCYQSIIVIDNKRINIGTFKQKIDCAIAYNNYLINNNIPKPLNNLDLLKTA